MTLWRRSSRAGIFCMLGHTGATMTIVRPTSSQLLVRHMQPGYHSRNFAPSLCLGMATRGVSVLHYSSPLAKQKPGLANACVYLSFKPMTKYLGLARETEYIRPCTYRPKNFQSASIKHSINQTRISSHFFSLSST